MRVQVASSPCFKAFPEDIFRDAGCRRLSSLGCFLGTEYLITTYSSSLIPPVVFLPACCLVDASCLLRTAALPPNIYHVLLFFARRALSLYSYRKEKSSLSPSIYQRVIYGDSSRAFDHATAYEIET